ncbi:MAG: Na/Pi symporter [Chromatiales bacterium]|jgi:phosphate:Na+ symporter
MHYEWILTAIGGLGLFLLGMVILTEGLKALAGRRLIEILSRFTSSPASGALTGAMVTAMLQSSSATTVAAIGFVAAGLLGFSQALGIIFGANLGTTVTGWLVALIGFKLKLGLLSLVFVFIGVLLRLFARGRLASLGLSLAGFGLVFVGIATLQEGMSALEGQITPADFPGDDTLTGILKLLGIGLAITLVTQSSSAGVATALTVLAAGAINFEQAAIMVIGMDIGTTVTAVIASLGGSLGARRTGLSHLAYNILTAFLALLILAPYMLVLETLLPGVFETNPEFALVGFHSLFNGLGVLLILPFANQFARLIEALVREKEDPLTSSLDRMLLQDPQAALTAVRSTQGCLMQEMSCCLSGQLETASACSDERIQRFETALKKTRAFVDDIHITDQTGFHWKQLMASLHALDHMERLLRRMQQQECIECASESKLLELHFTQLKMLASDLCKGKKDIFPRDSAELSAAVSIAREALREKIIRMVGDDSVSADEGHLLLRTLRWLDRLSHHLWRVTLHLEETGDGAPPPRT